MRNRQHLRPLTFFRSGALAQATVVLARVLKTAPVAMRGVAGTRPSILPKRRLAGERTTLAAILAAPVALCDLGQPRPVALRASHPALLSTLKAPARGRNLAHPSTTAPLRCRLRDRDGRRPPRAGPTVRSRRPQDKPQKRERRTSHPPITLKISPAPGRR
jgi:hypothetical protein